MELSLGNNNKDELTGGRGNSNLIGTIKKEHMFDKVVTPSDVGKLNRLVIPKQHAEKYFPLDSSSSSSSSNDNKGLLLNFEDSNGKPWRFRYSYWNSSQSYVMTKGWSRFVKDKKLDAGDIVSFHRGVGDQARHRLFIDCRRRPTMTPTLHVNHLQNLCHSDFAPVGFRNQFTFRWGNFPPPAPPPPPPQFHYPNNIQANYGNYAFYGMRPSTGGVGNHYGVGGGGGDDVVVPMVIDSVPVVEGRRVGKRLRLFGVNMDYCPVVPSSGNSSSSCCGEEIEEEEAHLVVGRPTTNGLILARDRLDATSSSMLNVGDTTTLQLRLPSSSTSSGSWGGGLLPMQSQELSKKGKTNSLSFDLDL